MNILERRTLGSALQRGLMSLGGYFDSHYIGTFLWPKTDPLPDWAVFELEDRGPGEYYRFRVGILNLNCAPGEYGHREHWRVHDLRAWRYRFELCPGAEGSLS
jgi:hypothetical protein